MFNIYSEMWKWHKKILLYDSIFNLVHMWTITMDLKLTFSVYSQLKSVKKYAFVPHFGYTCLCLNIIIGVGSTRRRYHLPQHFDPLGG